MQAQFNAYCQSVGNRWWLPYGILQISRVSCDADPGPVGYWPLLRTLHRFCAHVHWRDISHCPAGGLWHSQPVGHRHWDSGGPGTLELKLNEYLFQALLKELTQSTQKNGTYSTTCKFWLLLYSSQVAKEADRVEKEKKHLSLPVVKEWMIF